MAKQATTEKPEKPEKTEAELRAAYKKQAERVIATLDRAARYAEKLQGSRVAEGSDAQREAYNAEVNRHVKRVTAALSDDTEAASVIPDA